MILILVIALALLTAPPAEAGFQKRAVKAQAVAVNYWGAWPNCAEVRTVREPLFNEGAVAEADECTIYFRPDWFAVRWRYFFPRFCSVYLHEWGHLLGYAHTTSGLMAPNVPAVRACYGS